MSFLIGMVKIKLDYYAHYIWKLSWSNFRDESLNIEFLLLYNSSKCLNCNIVFSIHTQTYISSWLSFSGHSDDLDEVHEVNLGVLNLLLDPVLSPGGHVVVVLAGTVSRQMGVVGWRRIGDTSCTSTQNKKNFKIEEC